MDLSSTQGPTRSDSAPTAHTLESPRLPTYTTPSPTVAELGPTVRFVPFRSSSAVANPSTLDTRPSTPSTTSTLPVLPAGTHTRWWTRSYARKSMATPPAGAPGSTIEWTVRTDGAVADVSVGPARQPVARIARSSTAFRTIIGPPRGCRVTLPGARDTGPEGERSGTCRVPVHLLAPLACRVCRIDGVRQSLGAFRGRPGGSPQGLRPGARESNSRNAPATAPRSRDRYLGIADP